ncbi:MAG: heme exporter protein CcmD [Pseudomonadales bacterium]|nr:heme exporter protein CcmD [Pseudomonadales bacterium]
MYFDSFDAFLAMGKHGVYVWSAYGLAMVLLTINVIAPLLNRRKVVAKQQARLRRKQQKRASNP